MNWQEVCNHPSLKNLPFKIECPVAPEICVEVLSDSNTENEMAEKRHLYFARVAREVWVCDTGGRLRFFDADGEIKTSALAPAFPQQI
jgi:Uma2 family endonuclease